MSGIASSAPGFSLAEARAIVRDLFVPNEKIYWIDFLATILLGHACYAATRHLVFESHWEPAWLRGSLALATFAIQCALYYRAVMFVHELVHLSEKKFLAFRVAWNLLCGIPFMVPSFTYYTHLDHHRRRMFGTQHDGEYLALSHMSPWWIVVFFSQALWLPPLAVLRFGMIAPLTWFSPALRRIIHQRASSLVIDPTYIRPLPTLRALWLIRLQELGCFLCLAGYTLFPMVILKRWPIPILAQAYLTGVVLVFMNAVRTLASHRWISNGQEGTFIDQMLDSVTMDSDSLPAILINPVGLRYHATHHLFPSMPYHNMRAAHKRLLEELPADSLYRQTVARSVWPVIADLWRRAAENSCRNAARTLTIDAPGAQQELRSSIRLAHPPKSGQTRAIQTSIR